MTTYFHASTIMEASEKLWGGEKTIVFEQSLLV